MPQRFDTTGDTLMQALSAAPALAQVMGNGGQFTVTGPYAQQLTSEAVELDNANADSSAQGPTNSNVINMDGLAIQQTAATPQQLAHAETAQQAVRNAVGHTASAFMKGFADDALISIGVVLILGALLFNHRDQVIKLAKGAIESGAAA